MHVRINQRGGQVGALQVNGRVRAVARPYARDAPAQQRDIPLLNAAREDVDNACVVEEQIGRLVAAGHGQQFGQRHEASMAEGFHASIAQGWGGLVDWLIS